MPIAILNYFKKIKNVSSHSSSSSTIVADQIVLGTHLEDKAFPFLVSFPRTGSHWLRMLLELYFERPLLTRTFFYPEKNNYLLLHTHDLELDVLRENVIYIYRNPVETIYSQLKYHKQRSEDKITYWSDLYGRHLDKWLHRENVSQKKTIICYENLTKDISSEFEKICEHFQAPLDVERLTWIVQEVSKEKVKKKTAHDKQVVNLTLSYKDERAIFREEYGKFVWDIVLKNREYLKNNFQQLNIQ